MSNGRSEKRMARTVSVEVCLQDEPRLNERMLTENVSAHGARVLMEQKLQSGQQVLVNSPKEGVRTQARIIYCQRVSERRFGRRSGTFRQGGAMGKGLLAAKGRCS